MKNEHQTPWATEEGGLSRLLALGPICYSQVELKIWKLTFKRRPIKHAQTQAVLVKWSIY